MFIVENFGQLQNQKSLTGFGLLNVIQFAKVFSHHTAAKLPSPKMTYGTKLHFVDPVKYYDLPVNYLFDLLRRILQYHCYHPNYYSIR